MKQVAPCPDALAWCHSTDAYRFQQIVRCGELHSTDLCGVFGEPLSYWFLGRPAYEKACETSMVTVARAPVVILMSSAIFELRKRVFPFDTGAFVDGRYDRWVHEAMQLHEFEITDLSDSHRRFVASFYDNNLAYLTLKPRRPIVPYGDYYQVEALVAMLTDTDASRADDRRLAMELQVARPIPFEYPLVRGLILPRDLQESPHVCDFLSSRAGRDVKVRWFDVSSMKLASAYQELLERYALELQAQWGLL